MPESLARDLAALTESMQTDGDLSLAFEQLLTTGRSAANGCCGLSITIASRGQVVTFTFLDERISARDVLASLLLPLPLFSITEPGSRLVFFSDRAGAFVDLAADLSFATKLPLTWFALDAHLDVATTAGAPTGLAQLSMINQAIGVLIAEGMTPADSALHLRALAAAQATDTYAAARRIIGNLESR